MSEEYGNNGYNGYPTTGSDMNNTANNEHQDVYKRQKESRRQTQTM